MTTLSPAVLDPMTSCGAVTTADGRTLPLRATRLCVRAAGGLAQVKLIQTFANPYAEPLHVTYQLPLPADAAVGGFEFRLGDQRILGDIDRRAAARERFEQAIAAGRTAALLEQDRSALFTQELGNLPPGAELEATIDIDQPLHWHDGSWQWRFPTTVAPRYLGVAGRVTDAARLAVDVLDPDGVPPPPRCELDLLIADALSGTPAGVVLPASTSHELCASDSDSGMRVSFATGRVAMDRDVAVTWPVATPKVGMTLRTVGADRPALAGQAFAQLTLVPPQSGNEDLMPRPRDLIVLLDISGSMHGAPLAQAQLVTSALIDSLAAHDQLELIAFAAQPQAWSKRAMPATTANKASARAWLNSLQAGGGTEMHTAILAALASIRDGAQRQVVLVTDGLIGFEQEIVGTIGKALPAHSRVHVVGVGAAPNRTLTRGAARAGRGLEVLIDLGEDAAPAARRLLARTAAPLVDELEVSGSALLALAPRSLPDLFAGAPVRLALRIKPEGGTLVVRGASAAGAFTHELIVPAASADGDPAIARAFAREAVEDLEVELAAGGEHASVDARIEQLGLAHRIATRLTSWVAIAEAATVDPRAPHRHERVAHELPHGMSIERLGLRACTPLSPLARASTMPMPSAPMGAVEASTGFFAQAKTRKKDSTEPPMPRDEGKADAAPRDQAALPPKPAPQGKRSVFGRMFGAKAKAPREADAGLPPRATLRVRTASEWVFELSGLVAWQVPDRVVIVLSDGTMLELRVDESRTTRSGTQAGTVVRLTLFAPKDVITTPPIRVRLHTDSLTMDLPIA